MQVKTVISEQEEYNDALSKPFDGYIKPAQGVERVMAELSKIVPPDPTPTAKAQALEAAAQAARNWYKDQVLRPDDSLPVDYVCRQIGNAIMALANRP